MFVKIEVVGHRPLFTPLSSLLRNLTNATPMKSIQAKAMPHADMTANSSPLLTSFLVRTTLPLLEVSIRYLLLLAEPDWDSLSKGMLDSDTREVEREPEAWLIE